MTDDEHMMVREIHEWLFKPPVSGGETRARQLDEIMAAVRAGRISARALLWLAGIVGAIGIVIGPLREYWK